ncbi:MAG: hypothetical protein IPJ94_10265 [Chloroflexi bacterium]|nr:hypothetical protein [Chloroflexota bacterium]
MTIEYAMPDGQIRRYTPDYEIHEGIVKTLVECKPEARLESKHAQKQRQIGQLWAKEMGIVSLLLQIPNSVRIPTVKSQAVVALRTPARYSATTTNSRTGHTSGYLFGR